MIQLALAAALALPAVPAGQPKVTWRGRVHTLDELPDELPETARAFAADWCAWADEHDYTVAFTEDGRVAFVDERRKTPSKEWKLVQEVVDLCDEIAPLPEREETSVREASSDGDLSWTWGDHFEVEHEVAAFFRLRGMEDLRSLLGIVAERQQEPPGWAAALAREPGLVLLKPLMGVLVVNAPGMEEWSPVNETANRLARLLVARRFGRVPNWIAMGIAWNVELETCGSIYCFPHRSEFIGVGEHGGWRSSLQRRFSRSDTAFDPEEVFGWEAGRYDDQAAGLAWGTVSYLHATSPGSVGTVLEDLRLAIDAGGRVTSADGTWERIPDYEPTPAEQLELLRRRAGDEVAAELAAYFASGLKAPKRR